MNSGVTPSMYGIGVSESCSGRSLPSGDAARESDDGRAAPIVTSATARTDSTPEASACVTRASTCVADLP